MTIPRKTCPGVEQNDGHYLPASPCVSRISAQEIVWRNGSKSARVAVDFCPYCITYVINLILKKQTYSQNPYFFHTLKLEPPHGYARDAKIASAWQG
jgi:hypothetical protein